MIIVSSCHSSLNNDGLSGSVTPLCESSAGCSEISFSVLEQGSGNDQSNMEGAEYTFKEATSFSVFYNEFVCSIKSPCSVPSADFDNQMVIVVILGQKSEVCNDIEVDSVQNTNDVITIYVSTYEPNENDFCGQSYINPYEIIVIPSTTADIYFDYTEKNISEKGE